jgi:hypothetical protein
MGQDASAILEARTAAIRIAQNSKADHTKRDHSARAQEPNAMNPTVSMKKMANSAMGTPFGSVRSHYYDSSAGGSVGRCARSLAINIAGAYWASKNPNHHCSSRGPTKNFVGVRYRESDNDRTPSMRAVDGTYG